VKKHEE